MADESRKICEEKKSVLLFGKDIAQDHNDNAESRKKCEGKKPVLLFGADIAQDHNDDDGLITKSSTHDGHDSKDQHQRRNTGKWSEEEKTAFVTAFKKYGTWAEMAREIKTRNKTQVASYGYNYLHKEKAREGSKKRAPTGNNDAHTGVDTSQIRPRSPNDHDKGIHPPVVGHGTSSIISAVEYPFTRSKRRRSSSVNGEPTGNNNAHTGVDASQIRPRSSNDQDK